MTFDLRVIDESPAGAILGEFVLAVSGERITVRGLIERRVHAEVAAFNAGPATVVFRGLIQPSRAEVELNGYRLRERRLLDADAQCARAVEGFERGGFLIVVGDRQVEDLDDEIAITTETAVSFIKLVALVGG